MPAARPGACGLIRLQRATWNRITVVVRALASDHISQVVGTASQFDHIRDELISMPRDVRMN